MAATPAPAADTAAPDPVPAAKGSALPWWVPGERIWIAAAIFGLCWRILDMLVSKPELQDNKLFFAIATALFGGSGLLAVIGFWFMASKSGGKDSAQ